MRKLGKILGIIVVVLLLLGVLWLWMRPDRGTTGQVSTRFRWLGPNDKIVVDGFDDGLFHRLRDLARSNQFRQMRDGARAMAADHDISIGTAILVKTWIDASGVAPL